MPTDLVRRIDLDLLYPPFVDLVLQLLAACRARDADYYLTSGTRFWSEQEHLHQLYLARKGGRAAPPGFSQHQFGLAVDLTFDADLSKPGLQPRWLDRDYAVLGEEAKRLGLHWGAAYNDRPHIGWPKFVSGSELEPLRTAWSEAKGSESQRLNAVWKYLNAAS